MPAAGCACIPDELTNWPCDGWGVGTVVDHFLDAPPGVAFVIHLESRGQFVQHARDLVQVGMGVALRPKISALARLYGVSRATLCNILRQEAQG
jgi:hypothetical protein